MTKRIVLFSDVHGNITGLEEVMKEVNKLENLEYIIGLGDYFGWGAGRNDIIEYDEKKVAIIQRQIPYDKEEEDRLIEERGMLRRK